MTTEIVSTVDRELTAIHCENDPKKLWAIIAQCVQTTRQTVKLMTACIHRLQEMGCDISKIADADQADRVDMLKRIASGQLLEEVYVDFRCRPQLQKKVARLTVAEQKVMVEAKPIQIAMHGGNHRLVKPIDMTQADIRQVFGPLGLRSESEQIAYLHDEARRLKIKEEAAAARVPEVKVNKRRGVIEISGPMEISRESLERYLSQLGGGL